MFELFAFVAIVIGLIYVGIKKAIDSESVDEESVKITPYIPPRPKPAPIAPKPPPAQKQIRLTDEQFADIMDQLCSDLNAAFWFHARITGVTRTNNDGLNRQEVLQFMKIMDQLDIVPEPDNPADEFAQAVYEREYGFQAGYLEKHVAKEVNAARQLGMSCAAFVRSVDYAEGSLNLGARIGIILHQPIPDAHPTIKA